MRFLMWLSALRLGTWNGKEFATYMGRYETQISAWIREDPRPGWDVVKSLAVPVGISPTWLDDPRTPGAEEPPLFREWLESRRRWKDSQSVEVEAPTVRKVAERGAGYGAKKVAKPAPKEAFKKVSSADAKSRRRKGA